ncbi:hypothetical protein OIU84_002187 [Salix udensis]|uniref:Reverse transcriptase domain-containing protein n=1 Tax=Salix udensis TaxID=889485 RepID=A0AAD6K3L5_9ROSI|nr:hypothetical protein OIU84_002187 [Salix udensis]
MGGSKWRGWTRQCISTAKLSVLVNWHPTEDFAMEKGLRQGDSLSPFVFTIAAEGFSKMLERGCSMGLTEGISHGQNQMQITHHQFVDDILIFRLKKSLLSSKYEKNSPVL